jgi:hypothetical protein
MFSIIFYYSYRYTIMFIITLILYATKTSSASGGEACLGIDDASGVCKLMDPSIVAVRVVAFKGGETSTLLRNVNVILVA